MRQNTMTHAEWQKQNLPKKTNEQLIEYFKSPYFKGGDIYFCVDLLCKRLKEK